MKFIVSQSGFIADEEEGSPGRSIEISVGEKVVILLKQYAPTTVRFSWNGKHYSASKVCSAEHAKPETARDHI